MAIPRASPRAVDDAPHASPVSESSTDARSRFIVRPLLSSAAVTHAVRARMRRPDAVDVVLGKRDQLVLVVADDDGTRSRVRHAQHLHGTLTDLRALPSDGAVDLLAALSDSGNLSIFRFDDALSRFLSVRQLRLGPPGVARNLGRLVVDPRERRLALTRPDAARVTVFHPVPEGAPGDFESAGTPVEYSKHVAMDAAFAPRAPDASALVVLVTNDAEAKIGSEKTPRDAPRAFDAAIENLEGSAIENVEANDVEKDTRVDDDAESRIRRREGSRRDRFPSRVDAYFGDVRRTSPRRRSTSRVSVSLVEHAETLGPRARLVEPPSEDDARARDDACFFLIAGERVYLLVSARANGDAPVVRAIPNPDVEVPSRWTWLPEPKTDETRAGRSSSPSVWRLFVAGGARVSAPIVIDATDGWTRFGAFDEQSTRAPIEGRPTGVHEVTAILPAPLSNAPRGVVVFGRDGSAATVWTGARDVARRDARGHADATAFFLDANQGDDANVSMRTPPLAPVNHLAGFAKDDATSRATSAAMIAGGRAFRLTRGVATTASTASPPCFRDVTAMWTLGEDAIALSHADATSVFVALKPGESSFEEAIDGAGLVTNEPAVACGAWWSGNVVASWTQITPRRARLCADGALLSEWRPDRDAGCVGAAVVSSSGRAAASLPARGVVVILRRVGDALIETARVRVDAEPSCLEIPPPRVADALVRAMRATESCDDAFEDEDECVLLSGTYARALEVTAIRETREDSVRSTSDFSPFFRASIALDDDAGAPASIRVSARDETRPAVLVTTRTGELVLMEPRREARGACLARPIAPPPATPKPPRLLSGDALRARLDADPGPRDIETILVDAEGISSRRGPSPLELALADAPARDDVEPMAIESPDDEIEGVENVFGERDASSRPDAVAVPLRIVGVRRLCDEPLNLVSLGDAFLARGGRESWIVRDAIGAQRVSVERADAPEMSAACAMPANRQVLLAVVRGRLMVVRPDLEQRDPARRAPIAEVAADEDARITFLCEDDATGRVVATTRRGVARDWSSNEWACESEASRALWDVVSWKRAADRDSDVDADPCPDPDPDPDPDPENLASSNFVAVSGSSVVSDAEFHSVTAMTSCEPPADVDGGILAVGTSNPTTRARLRRMEGGGETEFDLEGHVFLMRLSDEVAREDEDGDSAKETIPVAATVRLYRPVACVAAGPAGMVIVAAGHETIVVRVQAGRKRKLEASLCATHVSRRPVLAVAASPISREIDDASDLRVAFALAVASRRDGVVLARVDAPSREPEWKDARVTHVAADATSRDAIALAMRRRGEVAGIDAEGRAFILQNRNDPRWLKQKRERETDEGEGASERVGEGSTGGTGCAPGPSSPERRLVVAASFTIRAIPTAMTMTMTRTTTVSKTKHADPTTFDVSDATFGPAVIIGTREGGAAEMREISAEDWATLREVQARMETHRLLAPVLGASHAHARGSWPSRAGFCRAEAPPPLADATELASSAPEVIDGYLLSELVDLPEEAQRAVLSGDAEGDTEGFARVPLSVEATMGVIMRVMEAA